MTIFEPTTWRLEHMIRAAMAKCDGDVENARQRVEEPLGWVVLCWHGRAAEIVGDERGEDDDRTLDGFHLTHAAAQAMRDEYAARWPALRYTVEPVGARSRGPA